MVFLRATTQLDMMTKDTIVKLPTILTMNAANFIGLQADQMSMVSLTLSM